MSEHSAPSEAPASHGHGHAADDHGHHGGLMAHAKPYLMVGVLLFVFTVITVGLSYIDFAEYTPFRKTFAMIGIQGMGINIAIGLFVATFKVCLVGWYFMHLKQETSQVWRPLFFTFFFVTGLLVLCLLAHSDPIPTTSYPLH
jgi:caa(3)-type oxidase subunit IV